MRKTVPAALATAALAAATITAAPTATAQPSGCVTQDEYNAVQLGWTRHRVESTFQLLSGQLRVQPDGTARRPFRICEPSHDFGPEFVFTYYGLDDAGLPRLVELSTE